MITRLVLLTVSFVAFHSAAIGQQYVTKQEFNDAIDRLSAQIAAIGGQPSPAPSADDRIAALEQRQEIMQQAQQDQGNAIGQIAKRSGNQYHWRFDATSQPAVNEFKKAIDAAVPTTGTLWVRNLTGSDQLIIINGKQERILPGAIDDFPVPVGITVTRISGESPKSWYVGMPKYQNTVEIYNRPYSPIITRIYGPAVPVGWVAAY